MSNSNFRDNFSYLAAFIAVLFGLSVFRDDISNFYINLFFGSFTIFQTSLVFLVIMILGMYFGALAILSKSFTFRLFPLTKILENISNTLAALGLLYPILVTLVYAVSVIASLIPSSFTQNVFVSSISAGLAGIAIGAAIRYASDKFIVRYEIGLAELRRDVNTEKTPLDKSQPVPYEIVMLYHQLVSLSRSILSLKGYGASGENLINITKNLISLAILKESDLDTVKKIQGTRNKIVHPDHPVSSGQLKTTRRELENLIAQLKVSLVTLDAKSK